MPLGSSDKPSPPATARTSSSVNSLMLLSWLAGFTLLRPRFERWSGLAASVDDDPFAACNNAQLVVGQFCHHYSLHSWQCRRRRSIQCRDVQSIHSARRPPAISSISSFVSSRIISLLIKTSDPARYLRAFASTQLGHLRHLTKGFEQSGGGSVRGHEPPPVPVRPCRSDR